MTDLRDRIRAGETLIGAFSDLASPLAAELLRPGRLRLDRARPRARRRDRGRPPGAALRRRHDADGRPRPAAVGRAAAHRRALDLGAAGIMLPQLQSADEVREAVRTCATRRSASAAWPCGRAARAWARSATPTSPASSTSAIVGIVQIESPGAVADADEIAALDEVDVLFVGPADLSHASASRASSTTRPTSRRCERSWPRAKRHGKAAGILLYDAAALRAPPRARVPVHRPRLGGLVRRGRGRARCWPPPAAADQLAGRADPRPRHSTFGFERRRRLRRTASAAGDVWATTTPMRIRAAPASWIGASVWSRKIHARTTMINGSTVADQRRLGRTDPPRARRRTSGSPGTTRRTPTATMPGHAAAGTRRVERPARRRRPTTAKTAAVAVIISGRGHRGIAGRRPSALDVAGQAVAALPGQAGREDDPDRVDDGRGEDEHEPADRRRLGDVDAAERQRRRRRPPARAAIHGRRPGRRVANRSDSTATMTG